jgi:hypothetical protein
VRDVNPGLVEATAGSWQSLNRHGDGSVNWVSASAFCKMGHAPSTSDNLVEVERV